MNYLVKLLFLFLICPPDQRGEKATALKTTLLKTNSLIKQKNYKTGINFHLSRSLLSFSPSHLLLAGKLGQTSEIWATAGCPQPLIHRESLEPTEFHLKNKIMPETLQVQLASNPRLSYAGKLSFAPPLLASSQAAR